MKYYKVYIIIICFFCWVSCKEKATDDQMAKPSVNISSEESSKDDSLMFINADPVLNMRESPDISSKILIPIPNGAKIKIIEKSSEEVEIQGKIDYWYKIDYNDRDGWAFGAYLSKEEPDVKDTKSNVKPTYSIVEYPSPDFFLYYVDEKNGIELKEKPSFKSSTLATVKYGLEVHIFNYTDDSSTKDGETGKWGKTLIDDKEGYVFMPVINSNKYEGDKTVYEYILSKEINIAGVGIYNSAHYGGDNTIYDNYKTTNRFPKSIGKIQSGEKIQILQYAFLKGKRLDGHNWVKIRKNDITGWVLENRVSEFLVHRRPNKKMCMKEVVFNIDKPIRYNVRNEDDESTTVWIYSNHIDITIEYGGCSPKTTRIEYHDDKILINFNHTTGPVCFDDENVPGNEFELNHYSFIITRDELLDKIYSED